MPKNLLGGKKPMATPPSMKVAPIGGAPMRQRGGKMKPAGLGKEAKRVAEEVPTGPMKGLR